MTAINHKSYYA